MWRAKYNVNEVMDFSFHPMQGRSALEIAWGAKGIQTVPCQQCMDSPVLYNIMCNTWKKFPLGVRDLWWKELFLEEKLICENKICYEGFLCAHGLYNLPSWSQWLHLVLVFLRWISKIAILSLLHFNVVLQLTMLPVLFTDISSMVP